MYCLVTSQFTYQGADRYEVRKAYRRLSMVHHPDRGGDSQKFQLVAKAYETYVFFPFL